MDNQIYGCRWVGCSASLYSPEDLYCHLKENHIGRKATRNLCLTCKWEKCNFTANKRDRITSHLKVHVPLNTYMCQFCKKTSKLAHDLKKHEAIHNKQRASLRQSRPKYSYPHQQQQQQFPHRFPTPPNPSRDSSKEVSPILSYDLSIIPPTGINSGVDYMHTSEPPPEKFDTSSSTHDHLHNFITPLQSQVQNSVTQIVDDDFNLEHILNALLFPTDIDAESVEYNQKVATTLDRIQRELNSGTVVQSDFSLNISNEQQLADLNKAIAHLSDSISARQAVQEPKVDIDQWSADFGSPYNLINDLNLSIDSAYNQMSLLNPPLEEHYPQHPMDIFSFNTTYPTSSEENGASIQTIVPNQSICEFNNDFSFLSDIDMHLEDQYQNALDFGSTLDDADIPKENKASNEEIDKKQKGSLRALKNVTYKYKKRLMSTMNVFRCGSKSNSVTADRETASLKTLKGADFPLLLPSRENQAYNKKIDIDETGSFKSSKIITYSYKEELMSVHWDCIDSQYEEWITDRISKVSISNDNRFQPEDLPDASSTVNNHLLLLEKIQRWINENYRKHYPATADTSISDPPPNSVLCQ